jgi:hypothetical protein
MKQRKAPSASQLGCTQFCKPCCMSRHSGVFRASSRHPGRAKMPLSSSRKRPDSQESGHAYNDAQAKPFGSVAGE